MKLTDDLKKKIDEWFIGDSAKEYFKKLKQKQDIKDFQLKRLSERNDIPELIEKSIIKYRSDKYKNKWFNRGYEPPDTLFYFLFDYALKYGRECTKEEWDKYSNQFTGELLYTNGYYINLMIGQGSFIIIEKENER